MFQFPSTSPTVPTVLFLTFTSFLTVTSNQEFNEAHYAPLAPGYSYGYLQTSPTDKFYPRESLLECAGIALNSQSEFFTYNNVSHVCKNYSPKNIMTAVSTNDSNERAYYRKSEWIKTYAISMGANSLIYNSFMNIGDPSTWNVDKCSGSYCPNFFRHPILDIWNNLPIDRVKLVIYKNQTAVVTMVFDGRDTTLENWFSFKNLISSPWDDLVPGNTNHFSIAGVASLRRFYVVYQEGGCPKDAGWMNIIEAPLGCSWEESTHFPIILYSKTNSATTWYNGKGVADSMAIFLQLKKN